VGIWADPRRAIQSRDTGAVVTLSAAGPGPSGRAEWAWAGVRERIVALFANRPGHVPSYAEQVYGSVLAPPLTLGDLSDLEA
jgi:hypothetical protein